MKIGSNLIIDANKKYTIVEEIGRGASCIVYEASYLDTIEQKHFVRIKECYPSNMRIERNEEGNLHTIEAYQNYFLEAKQEFKETYEKSVYFKTIQGLTNSVVSTMDLYMIHNTYYVIMICVEGQDYRKPLEESMTTMFSRLLALSKVIKKYHDNGLLYLDIKPENMWLIPETKEHILLFDFNSIVAKEDLQKNNFIKFSYSDGYSAPELIQGNKKKICEATDIYSIGAIAFYKLFGRTPNMLDGSVSTVYDFQFLKKKEERYQPELFRLLSEFLHKTIASSVTYRYKNIDTILPILEELIRKSDIDGTFLFHNFSYNSACFIGRKKEIEKINKKIQEEQKQSVFLYGIGGIGKTELAKRYAYEYSHCFRKIIFVNFTNSILETVCGEDIRIHKIEKEENETNEEYFWRKWKVLKSLVTAEDLIILDNFDVDYDEHLETLFECPCKFLITTREDYSDYGYEQIHIYPMENEEELLTLFRVYNKEDYTIQEIEQLKNIITIVDGHTMTVELIAKYLKTSEETPKTLLYKLMQKEGITSTEEIDIKHRKNKKLKADSINNHLLTLFDLAHFSVLESEILRSISLLGYVRIEKRKFLEFCPMQEGQAYLEKLIHSGWVEYDEETNKISLHQIILDLVYNYMQPSSENCPHIIKTMTDFLIRKPNNYVEKNTRNKLAKYFMQRITGNDFNYAKFCVFYCSQVRNKIEYLNIAEKICFKYKEKECYELLQSIYRMKIKISGEGQELWNAVFDEEIEESRFLEQYSFELCELAENAYQCAKQYSNDDAYLSEFCITLAMELDSTIANNLMTILLDEDNKYVNRIFDKVIQLFDDAEQYLSKAIMEISKKQKLYCKMRDFFGSYDYAAMYRSEHYGDARKAYEYQMIIDELQEKKDDIFYINDVNLVHIAEEAETRKEYEKAIELYYEAYRKEEESYQIAFVKIAHLYLKLGNKNKAIEQLEKVLEWDRYYEKQEDVYILYTDYACCELIDLLIEEDRIEEAKQYAYELIEYNKAEEYSFSNLTWLIAGYYRLYCLEQNQEQKKNDWETCVFYFLQYPEEEKMMEENADFLIELASKEKDEGEKIKKAFEYLTRFDTWCNTVLQVKFLDYMLSVCKEKEELLHYKIFVLIEYSKCMLNAIEKQEKKALEYILQAKELYETSKCNDEYIESLLYKTLGECYSNLSEYDYEEVCKIKQKCNYFLLAEKDSNGKKEEDQIELWKDTANEYQYLDNYAMEECCYEKIIDIMLPVLYQYDYSSFYHYFNIVLCQVRCYLKQNKKEEVKKVIFQICNEMMKYYMEQSEDKEDKKSRIIYQNLLQCADYMKETSYEIETFVLYIMAIFVVVHSDISKMVILKVEDYMLGKWGKWLELFSDLLHGTITDQNVDDIVDVYEKMMPLFQKNEKLKVFKEELEWFSAKYQHHNIEFKR